MRLPTALLDCAVRRVSGVPQKGLIRMKITANAVTTSMLASPDENQVPGAQVYRSRKRFAAVQVDAQGTGQIVFLAEGAELRVVGPSRVGGCLEVLCGRQRYHMFKVDLWGAGCIQMEAKPSKRRHIESARATVAVRAYA